VRIIGGKYRGRVLSSFKGSEIRPTADRVKESLFNILAPEIHGANMLDLFCGCGNVGLEAISRGADFVVFNDISKDSLAVLKKNLALIKSDAKIYNSDYKAFLESTDMTFDIIFIDPPYKSEFGINALKIIGERNLLTTGGIAVFESDKPFNLEIPSLVKYDERKYGSTYLTFFTPD